MDYLKTLTYSLIFLIGFLSCLFIALFYVGTELPLGINGMGTEAELEAPGNWIRESQVHVYDNALVIDIEYASLSRYAPTGSMKPVLDEYSNGIRIKPSGSEEVRVGDIVTFEQDAQLIVHRVIEKGEDEQGYWFITKGDNSPLSDGKIRFEQIEYVTIGILF